METDTFKIEAPKAKRGVGESKEEFEQRCFDHIRRIQKFY